MLAAYHGHADLVRFLLQHGADPNRLNDRRQSPLAGAVFKKEDDVIEVSRQEQCFLELFPCPQSSRLRSCSRSQIHRLLSRAVLTQTTVLPPPSSASPCSSRRIGGRRYSNLHLVGVKLHPARANEIRLNTPAMGFPRGGDHCSWDASARCSLSRSALCLDN